jgi:hypothetical protein
MSHPTKGVMPVILGKAVRDEQKANGRLSPRDAGYLNSCTSRPSGQIKFSREKALHSMNILIAH